MFPTDPVTLAGLRSACAPGPGESTRLQEFLGFGSVVGAWWRRGDVVTVDFVEGRAPWSEPDVIVSLCDEIERLRSESGAADGPGLPASF